MHRCVNSAITEIRHASLHIMTSQSEVVFMMPFILSLIIPLGIHISVSPREYWGMGMGRGYVDSHDKSVMYSMQQSAYSI